MSEAWVQIFIVFGGVALGMSLCYAFIHYAREMEKRDSYYRDAHAEAARYIFALLKDDKLGEYEYKIPMEVYNYWVLADMDYFSAARRTPTPPTPANQPATEATQRASMYDALQSDRDRER